MGSRDCLAPPAFVISLDFELHWGVRDKHSARGAYRENLVGAREAIRKLLQLFERYEVACTWATVGLLFAGKRDEHRKFSPRLRPKYEDPALDAYAETVGADEASDPIHFGASIVHRIIRTARQELATHTYSHFYCLEPGQTADAFNADLEAAAKIAFDTFNVPLRSIVFPRNQYNPSYDGILLKHGIRSFRGTPARCIYRPSDAGGSRNVFRRAGRLLDAFIGPGNLVDWCSVLRPNGLTNVPASVFLRPFTPGTARLHQLHIRRIKRAMRAAAEQRKMFHLWWHPHNFGKWTDENIHGLEDVLGTFQDLKTKFGMESMSMIEADKTARQIYGSPELSMSPRAR